MFVGKVTKKTGNANNVGEKNSQTNEFILFFAHLFVPLHAK
jgi:hypothetical protein